MVQVTRRHAALALSGDDSARGISGRFGRDRRATAATTPVAILHACRDRPWILVVVAVAGAVEAADVSSSIFPAGGLFLILLVPVVLGSALSGVRLGALALGLGATGAILLALARGHPWLSESSDVLRLLLYLLVGAAALSLAEARPASIGDTADRGRGRSGLVEPLTVRETQVVDLAARGLSTDGIASELCLSPNTVKSHLAHAYGKLGARNRAEAVAAAVRVRAIELGPVEAAAGVWVAGGSRGERAMGPPRG
jgi:DNA-binding CsgD family transcriptional regulator